MTHSITFDTNTLEYVCRPERHPKNPQLQEFNKIHNALVDGCIKGFFSETIITIEGMECSDRISVFDSTRLMPQTETVNDEDGLKITTEYQVVQPGLKPLNPLFAERIQVAINLGLKYLRAPPRIGQFCVDDPTGKYSLNRGQDDALEAWIEKSHEVTRAIETRGVGIAQIKRLGNESSTSGTVSPWFKNLNHAARINNTQVVVKAFNEWADGDSIASHVAYGLDIFCTEDFGKSNPNGSILDCENRAWLTKEYGVCFMTINELATKTP